MKKGFLFGIGFFCVIIISIILLSSQSEKSSKITENDMEIAVNKESKQNNTKGSNNSASSPQKSNDPATSEKVSGETENSNAQDPNSTDKEINKLRNKYSTQFLQINSIADKKVDSLIVQAQKEYSAKKEKKEELTLFHSKYEAILENYEQNIKAQFDSVYNRLEQEKVGSELRNTVGKEFLGLYQNKKIERYKKLKTELETLSK